MVSNVGAQVVTSISSATATAGQSVTLNIAANTASGSQPSSVEWTMSYPSADITGVSVAAAGGDSSAGKSVSCSYSSQSATCVAYGINQGALPNGTIASAKFQTSASAPNLNVPITISNTIASDANGGSISDRGLAGAISLTPAQAQLGLMCSSTSVVTPGTASCSASLSSAAPAGGATVNLSSNNSLLKVPASVSIPAGNSSAAFTATASAATYVQNATVTATGGSNAPSVTLALMPPVSLTAFSCTASSIQTPGLTTCSVSLNEAAPAGGVLLRLSSNDSFLTVPPSLTVAAGASNASFTAQANSVPSSQTATIKVMTSSQSMTNALSLLMPSALTLTNLTCNSTNLVAGQTTTCTVTLSGTNYSSSGIVVQLVSLAPQVTVPATVTVPVGAQQANFIASVSPSSGWTTVPLLAMWNGASPLVFLYIAP